MRDAFKLKGGRSESHRQQATTCRVVSPALAYDAARNRRLTPAVQRRQQIQRRRPSVTEQDSETQAATADSAGDVRAVGLISDGAYTLVVGRFPTMDEAEAAYDVLEGVERDSRLRIDGVVIASCDADGKVHLGKVTEHSTKAGLKWGVVGGVALGVLFPPSILASVIGGGTIGAAVGKVTNLSHRAGLAEELEGVMEPNTAGIVALVEDTAVVEVRKALAKADEIVEKAVAKEIAAEIDREAARAKASLGD
jgi:uncharacterized membrane protein